MTLPYVEAAFRMKANGQRLQPSELLVLTALAAMAGRDGSCFYRQSFLAERTQLAVDTVKLALRSLAAKGLIDKEVRYAADGKRPVATAIKLTFPPAEIGRVDGGVDRRQSSPPPGRLTPPPPGRISPPPLNRKGTESEESPLPPEGGATVRQADVEAVWETAPTASRQRSTSKAEVRKALAATYRRGHTLEEVIAGLRGYYASREATREDGRWVKGVHRIIANDRYLAFTASAAVHHIAEADPWPFRLRMWLRHGSWEESNWGPRPEDPSGLCKAPPEQVAAALEARKVERAERLARKAAQA